MKPEDLDRMLDHCKKLVAANQHAYVDPDRLWMARFILETLGVAFPCGFAQPRVAGVAGAVIKLGDSALGSRDEALGIASAIVRRALALPEGTP